MSRAAGNRHRIGAMLLSCVVHLIAATLVFWVGASRPHPREAVQGLHGSFLASGREAIQAVAERATILPPANRRSPGVHTLIDHLWQSTLFALATGLLTSGFRRSEARVRYWLWLAASGKFLVPFTLLVMFGASLPRAPALPPASSAITAAAPGANPPLSATVSLARAAAPASSNSAPWSGALFFGVWACGFLAVLKARLRVWAQIRRAASGSRTFLPHPRVLPADIEVREASSLREPGVVGFWRQMILLPVGLSDHLSPAQFDAVLLHERYHVERHDNLTAAPHMVVEAIFWFHPMVWWIGSRLVAERERACDEAVLRRGIEPRAYADGIVTVCRRYVDARIPCVSGVGGSNLKTRIEAIMNEEKGDPMDTWRTVLLAAAVVVAVGAPIVVGTLRPPVLHAQSPAVAPDGPAFEVASIKQNRSPRSRIGIDPQPSGRFTGTNVSAAMLVRFAWSLPDFQVFGGPNWFTEDRFDLSAKAEREATVEQQRLMLRRLLAERFKLTVHAEMRELPLYTMLTSRPDGQLGPRLRRSQANCAEGDQATPELGIIGPSPAGGPPTCGYFGFAPGTDFPSGQGGMGFRGLTMTALSKRLTTLLRRSVIERTGLSGSFDGEFDFIAEVPPPPPPPGMPNPFQTPFVTIFTVLPEQLGVKLEPGRSQVQVLVIDRAERPTED